MTARKRKVVEQEECGKAELPDVKRDGRATIH